MKYATTSVPLNRAYTFSQNFTQSKAHDVFQPVSPKTTPSSHLNRHKKGESNSYCEAVIGPCMAHGGEEEENQEKSIYRTVAIGCCMQHAEGQGWKELSLPHPP